GELGNSTATPHISLAPALNHTLSLLQSNFYGKTRISWTRTHGLPDGPYRRYATRGRRRCRRGGDCAAWEILSRQVVVRRSCVIVMRRISQTSPFLMTPESLGP